jgi:hypothetical protein
MKTLKLFYILIFAALFSLGKLSAQTVYVTENGKKYHAKNCSLAKTGKKGIELKEALKQGYEPCKQCKSDAVLPEKEGKGKKK